MKLSLFFQKTTSTSEKIVSLHVLFAEALLQPVDALGVELLTRVVSVFRPKQIKDTEIVDLSPLLKILSSNEQYRKLFVDYIRHLIYRKDFYQIVTDAGIIKDTDFSYEVRKRVIEKIIPDQQPKHTLQYILNQVFYFNTDPQWIAKIPYQQIIELYQLCEIKSIYDSKQNNFELAQLMYSVEVLIGRMSGRAMETEVNKMVPEYQNFDSPFIAFQREIIELNELFRTSSYYIYKKNERFLHIMVLHKQCVDYVKKAFDNSKKFGISLRVNQSLLRIQQQLERIKELLSFLSIDESSDRKKLTIQLALRLIEYNCIKGNIGKLINESTQLLSYEITQHTAHTGEHYITETRTQYIKMFKSAAWGGVIVAFLCIFKVLLGKVDTSLFGHLFLYSMNYSLGFIAIYLLGGTLATKQPAMTASALVRALEVGIKNKGGSIVEKYKEFATFFARVFRSQFIAFVGNVLVAFPVALLLIWTIDLYYHYNIAEQKWYTLVHDLNPIASPAIFHAGIAGCFLFFSGIIAGSVANRDKHNRIYYRIEEHPILKKTFGKNVTHKFASFYEKKWAGISSNFWFGIFMGSVAPIAGFFELNLDIRHITFASGNFALGLYGNGFHVSIAMIIWGIIGIGIIGLVNFLVSFTLSLILAFRSRNISLVDLKFIGIAIWSFFKENPRLFFLPPKDIEK